MIVSASRRTDIPAYYSGWFFERLRAGEVSVRNPFNRRQERRVGLSPGEADAFVFWTKDPAPMMPRLGELAGRDFYFQFTLTPYGCDAEPGLRPKAEIEATFRELARAIGPERVVWRYDPIFFSEEYTPERHEREFGRLAASLAGSAERCVASFFDSYRRTARGERVLGIRREGERERRDLISRLVPLAASAGMTLALCAEEGDYSDLGAGRSRCIDAELLERISGGRISAATTAGKDKGQRPFCGCCPSVDIGEYGTCLAGCLYCYAGGARPKN